MTLNRKLILAVLALLAGLMVLYVIHDRTVHAPPAMLARFERESPSTAPAVAFFDDSGAAHHLTDFRGRYVLLNLWASWCAPCVRELPELALLSGKMPSHRFVVVAVAIPPGTMAMAKSFLASNGAARLPAYFDRDAKFVRSFRAYGLPVTILIDPVGREIGRAVGAQSWGSPDAVNYLKAEMSKSDRLGG